MVAGLSILALSACSDRSNDPKKRAMDANAAVIDSTGMKKDVRFAIDAADGGMLEIELGRLAQVNASADIVKVFGTVMMTDHTKTVEQLKALTDLKSIVLPAALSLKNKKRYDRLAEKKGQQFDEAYISFMIDDHQEDINHFSKQARHGKDPDLTRWAAHITPLLEEHLLMAKRADSALRRLYKFKS
jgi:putative membrane protein